MTKKNGILFITLFVFFCSCQNRESNRKNKKDSSGTEIKSEGTSLEKNVIVSSTTINKDGISLKYTFNNSNGTCVLELNGETIELKQERTASGIKYSNEHFIYTNWHGETSLSKDGKVIFSDSR